MSGVLLVIVLALLWTAITGRLDLPNVLLGLVLSTLVVGLASRSLGLAGIGRRTVRSVRLAVSFLWDLVVSSVRVAITILSPSMKMTPGIIRIPLKAKTDLGIVMVANLTTLTPGTLTLDVAPDRGSFYVHAMFLDDHAGETTVNGVRDLERRVMEIAE